MRWDGVKPGTTIEWRSEDLPEGYIENIGDDISRTDYRRIFAAWGTTYGAGDGSNTFGTPDDRGEFKRGLDRGRGVDPGRSISAHQMDQFQGHRFGTSGAAILQSGVAEAGNENRSVVRLTGGTTLSIQTDGTNGTPRVGNQTRARNNAVIYLTKV
nr:phage tail protein [Halomonas ethanolica]